MACSRETGFKNQEERSEQDGGLQIRHIKSSTPEGQAFAGIKRSGCLRYSDGLLTIIQSRNAATFTGWR